MKVFYIIFFSFFILISKVSLGGERYVCDVTSKHLCDKLGCSYEVIAVSFFTKQVAVRLNKFISS